MKKMKKITDGKLFWLIISFLISFSVWVYITTVETKSDTKVLRNVQVVLVGEDTLLDNYDLVVTGLDTTNVSITVSGPRWIVNGLDSSDVIAQVDVSRLSMPSYTPANSATLPYNIVFPSGVDTRNLTIERKSQESVIVEVSKMDEITVPVGGNFLGEVSEEYRKDTPIFDPAVITVRGPKKYLVNVDHAYVEYGEAGMVYSGTFTDGNARVVLMDSSNKPCENTEYLSLSADTVSVTLPVLAQKVVPIAITPQYSSGATEENTRITYEPETLKLAGDSAVLDEINQIQLDIVDMSTFGTSTTLKYTIRLPNGIRNISGITEATVTIEIQGVETKMFEVDQFVWTGVRDDVEVVVETEKLPVLLRGPSKFLNNLTPNNIRVEADLSELMDTMGNHTVEVKVSVPGNNKIGPVRIDGEPTYTVYIQLKQKEANS